MATKVTVPTDSEGLREVLLDRKKMDEIYADPSTFAEFMTNYATAANKTGDIESLVNDRIQEALTSFAKDNFVNLKRPDMRPANFQDVRQSRQTGAAYNKHAMGAKLDGEFENYADFFQTIWHRTDRTENSVRERLSKIKNALSSDVPAEGGFLIPEEFRAELLRVALETAIVRPRARVIPMTTARVAMPMVDATTNSGSLFGGVVAYWTEEAASLVESSPSFAKVVLDASKLTAYSDIPNELADDANPALQAFLAMAFPEAMAFAEDEAFLVGDGAGQPLGALSTANPAIITQSATASGNSIEWTDVVNMYSRMLPSSLSRAVWVVAPDVFPQLAMMQAPGGTGSGPIWLTDGTNSPVMTILGRPVLISEKVPALGSQGDISFVDFGYYLIGDRMAMTAATSPHYKFGQDITSYRLIERVDGRPWLNSAITPRNGSSQTLSPFVQLSASGR